MDRLEVDLAREREVAVPEARHLVDQALERDAHRVLDEPWLEMGVLDDEQLVGSLQELEHGGAHRALDEIDERLGVDVAGGADEQRAAAPLVVGRDRDELEDLLDVARSEARLGEPLGGPAGDEALGARAGVDARRLDAHDPARVVLGCGRDADQRDHLLRRQARHRRHPAHRPAGGDPHLGADGALALDDVPRDHLGDLLDDAGLAEHGVADRLVEHLGKARHVDALLPPGQVDGALDLGGHHRLQVAAPDPDRLVDTGHARAREGELDRRRGRLHVGDEMRPVGHRENVAARLAIAAGARAAGPSAPCRPSGRSGSR